MIQSNLVNTDTEGDIESVHIKRIEFRENVGAFFPQGQNKLPVITMSLMCLYKAGARKVRFDCTSCMPFWLASLGSRGSGRRGGMVLPYISHVDLCRHKGYGFWAVLVGIRVWYRLSHFGLESSMVFD